MIANEIISDITKHEKFKAALEEMASLEVQDLGEVHCSTTFTANLDAGEKTVRISIAMIDEGEMFEGDVS